MLAIPVNKPRTMRLKKVFASKSSNCPMPNVALFCCPAAGSSNVPSVGWRVFADSLVIMSAFLKPSLVYTTLPSPSYSLLAFSL
jgi:hypothetical protein